MSVNVKVIGIDGDEFYSLLDSIRDNCDEGEFENKKMDLVARLALNAIKESQAEQAVKFSPINEFFSEVIRDFQNSKCRTSTLKVDLDLNDFEFGERESLDLLQEIAVSMGEVNTGASKHLKNKYGNNFEWLKYRDKLKVEKYLVERLEQFSMK